MSMQPPEPFQEKRPWGEELWITRDSPSMVKILSVSPGEALSLQFHKSRDEYWHVLSGNGSAVVGDETRPLAAGTDCFVPRGTNHRLTGGSETLVLLELAFGDYDEKDIVRLEDKYGRA